MFEQIFASVKPPFVYKTMLVAVAAGKLALWPSAAPIFSTTTSSSVVSVPWWTGIVIGLPCFLGGALLALVPKKLFQKTKTPMMGRPTAESPLHTENAFAYTRNPMYLGISIGIAGAALMTNCLWHLAMPILNMAIMDIYYIPKEEEALLERFGKRYMEYQKRVRRWI